MKSTHPTERIEEMVCELEGCRWDAIIMSATWRPDKSEIWETHQKHILMGENSTTNAEWELYVEQEVATKNYRHRLHQRTGHHCNDHGKPPTHQTDERLSPTLGTCGPPRRENVQNHCTRLAAKIAYRLLEETSTLIWDQVTELNVQVLVNTHSTEETREDTWWSIGWWYKIHSTQHDVQEDSWEANDIQISKRIREAHRLHHNQEKTLEIQQRYWSQRHDPHGQRPQMCHGNIRDHHTKERWLP